MVSLEQLLNISTITSANSCSLVANKDNCAFSLLGITIFSFSVGNLTSSFSYLLAYSFNLLKSSSFNNVGILLLS